MSGGSFGYLCDKDFGQLVEYAYDLSLMADKLDAEFPGSQAAADTRAFFDRVRKLQDVDFEDAFKALKEVWHDVEWWQSGDYSRDTVQKTVDEYKRPEKFKQLMSWIP